MILAISVIVRLINSYQEIPNIIFNEWHDMFVYMASWSYQYY